MFLSSVSFILMHIDYYIFRILLFKYYVYYNFLNFAYYTLINSTQLALFVQIKKIHTYNHIVKWRKLFYK